MQIDTDSIAQQCINAINDKINNLKQLNIIVIGKSGVGKSTLINSLFRGDFADTGLGRPVTQEIRKIIVGNQADMKKIVLNLILLYAVAYHFMKKARTKLQYRGF